MKKVCNNTLNVEKDEGKEKEGLINTFKSYDLYKEIKCKQLHLKRYGGVGICFKEN